MTLQQLKYVIEVAKAKSISEAAKKLFISQPSLTNAIKELEKEMNITIFLRTNKGILISKERRDFFRICSSSIRTGISFGRKVFKTR